MSSSVPEDVIELLVLVREESLRTSYGWWGVQTAALRDAKSRGFVARDSWACWILTLQGRRVLECAAHGGDPSTLPAR